MDDNEATLVVTISEFQKARNSISKVQHKKLKSAYNALARYFNAFFKDGPAYADANVNLKLHALIRSVRLDHPNDETIEAIATLANAASFMFLINAHKSVCMSPRIRQRTYDLLRWLHRCTSENVLSATSRCFRVLGNILPLFELREALFTWKHTHALQREHRSADALFKVVLNDKRYVAELVTEMYSSNANMQDRMQLMDAYERLLARLPKAPPAKPQDTEGDDVYVYSE